MHHGLRHGVAQRGHSVGLYPFVKGSAIKEDVGGEIRLAFVSVVDERGNYGI